MELYKETKECHFRFTYPEGEISYDKIIPSESWTKVFKMVQSVVQCFKSKLRTYWDTELMSEYNDNVFKIRSIYIKDNIKPDAVDPKGLFHIGDVLIHIWIPYRYSGGLFVWSTTLETGTWVESYEKEHEEHEFLIESDDD